MKKYKSEAAKAIYLVMLNLCTYSKLMIFKTNMFIYLGWLPPFFILAINFAIEYVSKENEPYRKFENSTCFVFAEIVVNIVNSGTLFLQKLCKKGHAKTGL